jgi:hypothetical protein
MNHIRDNQDIIQIKTKFASRIEQKASWFCLSATHPCFDAPEQHLI